MKWIDNLIYTLLSACLLAGWYALRFTGPDSEINVASPAGHKPEFIDWRWEPMKNLPELIVPFKRPVYERVVEEFTRFAGK